MQIPKILIIDDENVHQIAIMDILEECGESEYEIFSAFNGKEALEIALKEKPDLIISDWEMPVMNGIEFLKHLKIDKTLSDIPVIMCTGIMTSSENLKTALDVGANDYIRKPIDKIELMARMHANLHLASKYNEVKKLNEVKDKIFSVISHDLKGPIGTLKNYIDLILRNAKSYPIEKIEKQLTSLSKQSGLVYSNLQNLLLWANSQQNNIRYSPIEQLLVHPINNCIALLEATANNKGIEIINNLPEDLSATFDRELISTVVRNLISNAIKFTSEGAITLSAEKGNSHHTIIVSDTGVGIKPESITKVFDDASYESTYGTNQEKGLGLGLKLCRKFIEIHQGKIWVESEQKKGSTFYFTIPK